MPVGVEGYSDPSTLEFISYPLNLRYDMKKSLNYYTRNLEVFFSKVKGIHS